MSEHDYHARQEEKKANILAAMELILKTGFYFLTLGPLRDLFLKAGGTKDELAEHFRGWADEGDGGQNDT